MKNRERVQAELQAHADQLQRFCDENELGFFLGLTDGEHMLRASNIGNEHLPRILASINTPPIDKSYREIGKES